MPKVELNEFRQKECPIIRTLVIVMRLLLIEDDLKLAGFISKGLKEAGFVIEHANDGNSGLQMALNATYDAALIDIMLPSVDGLTIIEQLRQQKIRLPVIILSAKRSIDERVEGLYAGGDDYLTKPFAFSELLARIQALIRRSSGTPESTKIEVADLSIDLRKHIVSRSGKKIVLQRREFSLLEYLARNAGRVVSKTMIMEHVWDYHFDPQTNVVGSRISRLRDKIDKDFDTHLIHTVRGFGYVLKDSG